MLIKEIIESERPRERLLKYGVEALSNEELLSIILKTGKKGKSVKEIAASLLKEIKKIENLKEINLTTLEKITGIGPVKAMEILSVVELGKRIYLNEEKNKKKLMTSSLEIYKEAKYLFNNKKQEYFYCFYINGKGELIERKLLFVGTINRSVVHPREVFKHAYLCSATGIICLHNHPNGDPFPSKEDVIFTKRLVELGELNQIPIVDHLIFSDHDYYSFNDEGDILNI